jgi:glycyl-tRNA synthetase
MAKIYAAAAGESPAVAQALLDTELPRAVGDPLPATAPGAVLALADRMDVVIGLAATVGLPAGSSDPFAVRRAALGALALARSRPELADLSLTDVARTAAAQQPVDVGGDVLAAVAEFLTRRLEQQFIDEGRPVDRVRAVLRHADRPAVADRLLRQLDELAGTPEFARVAAALQRARRILRPGVEPRYDAELLVEPAERRLHETLQDVRRDVAALGAGDLAGFVARAGRLADAIDEFFTEVLVITDDQALQASRLGLLAAVSELGASQLGWEELVL